MYAQAPPVPPPKPGSHEASRISTPTTTNQSPRQPPLPDAQPSPLEGGSSTRPGSARPSAPPDPGDQWVPVFLQDKSKQDLHEMLSSTELLSGLTHAPSTIHPSLRASHESLQAALADNVELARQLLEQEARLSHQRSATQAQLLATHALERQWRQKQADMDHALAPFAPASLYQRLNQGVQEQEGICRAMEDSFLDGGGGDDGALATEREALDWVRRYRETKKLYYLRQERKERWDEGRVGGWR